MFSGRTDMAIERHARLKDTLAEGLDIHRESEGDLDISVITVKGPVARQACGKPDGTYITIDLEKRWQSDAGMPSEVASALSRRLSALLPKEGLILIVGLGNRTVTPDSLGPLAVEKTIVTRHLMEYASELFPKMRPVAAVAPGVMGQTGIETMELVCGVCQKTKPSAVIAIDALAASSLNRLGSSFQLSTSGIIPDEGARNKRLALDRNTLKIPVIAIGVPTVAELSALTGEKRGSAEPFMVAPADIDVLVKKSALAIGYGINMAIHGEMSISDMEQLLS